MKTNIKTEWNLKLLYKSHTDPKIESDLKMVELENELFEKKYKNVDFTTNTETLFKALTDYEKLVDRTYGTHALQYFYLSKDIDANDKKAEAEINKINDRLTKSSNKIIFFELALGKISEAKKKEYLNLLKFKHFKYFLEGIFKRAKHNLTEAEEKILSLKSMPSRKLWISGVDKLLSKQTLIFKGKEIPIASALSMISTLPTKDRHALHKLAYERFKAASDFAEAEVNAVYIDKKINDELRGFKNPYDATLLSHETDEKIVLALSNAVQKGYKISHRFYKLKAKLLKLNKLTYADRNVGIGKVGKEIPFEKGLEIVKDSFKEMDVDFENILTTYLKNGQVDVYPKRGKTGGAYCTGNINTPTYLLLNHTPDMKSVMTLAHEAGHGIHTEYSKIQPVLYQGYSTATAEVASTFFEQVVFDNILKTLSPKEQVIALHDHINDSVQTIFRQIACFNFERDLHTLIRKQGSASKEEIAALMNKHMKAYLGPVFELSELDGYFFVNWSHIRRFFYVYSYAFGCLVSKALYQKYKENPAYLSEIKKFLSAGGSKSPQDIFKDIGIDTSDPKFWEEGLASIEDDIKRLEKLTK